MTAQRSAADTIGVGPSFGLPVSVSIFRCRSRQLSVRAEVFFRAESFRQCSLCVAWRRAARAASCRPSGQ
jgi:hypothetical protein